MPAVLSAPWPPLSWNPDINAQYLDRLFAVLPADDLGAVRSYVKSLGALRWATCCSGSESPAWVMEPLEAKLRTMHSDCLKIQTCCLIVPLNPDR